MAITDLEQCVLNALRALASAALQALKSTIEAYILYLEGQLAILIAKALPLQIVKAQLEAQAALVRSLSDFVKNVSNLLPTELVDGPCVQLSIINLDIADTLAPISDTLDAIENDLLLAAALVDLNGILRQSVQRLIDDLNNILDAITVILDEQAQAALAG